MAASVALLEGIQSVAPLKCAPRQGMVLPQADWEAVDRVAKRKLKAALPRLPTMCEQLRQCFEARRSLRMAFPDAVSTVMAMQLAPEGLSRSEAAAYLQILAREAPDWLSLVPPAGRSLYVSSKCARACGIASRNA